MRSLHDSWQLGGVTIPNRVVLAPLAGIGNWFVRLQAKRYGAGLAVSEMVSSFAIHYGNRKTHDELLTIDPREREGGPVAIQLFGHDPEVMRSAAAHVARARRRHHRPQHGLPGAQGDEDGRRRRAAAGPRHGGRDRARRARGLRPARSPSSCARRGSRVAAQRLVEDAGVAGITFHPRTVKVRHKGTPDYDLAAQLVQDAAGAGDRHRRHGRRRPRALGVRVHRLRGRDAGARHLGNPWLFEQVLGARDAEPAREEILDGVGVGGGPRGGASGRRPGRALPAQVPPLVPRAAGLAACRVSTRSSGRDAARAARDHRRLRCYHARPRRRLERSPLVRPVRAFSFSGPHPKDDDMQKDVILTPEGLEKLKQEIEDLSTTSAARSPNGSRRRASSATSPRTPSTTTPRTSRRCSRRGSRRSRTSCARPR